MRRLLFVCFLLLMGPVVRAHAASEPLKIELSVAPELSAYVDSLFSAPSYAVLALQNSGLALSLSMPVSLESRASFRVGPAKVKFLERKDKIYHFSATLILPLGKEIVVPVELDPTEMARGQLMIRAYPPLSGLIPQELVVRVESKLRILTSPNAQKQLITYLSERSGGNLGDATATTRLFDAIAFDAYNQSGQGPVAGGGPGKDVGASEPFSDQLSLFLAVLIWLVGFPVFVYVVRRQRSAQANSGSLT